MFLKSLTLLLTVAMITSASAQSPTPAAKPVTIALFGDSTVASYKGGDRVSYGWGHFLQDDMGSGYEVKNYAKGGTSSKSFWGRTVPALAEHPDIVVVQFGHNDQPGKGPDRETDAATTYREWIKKYITSIREAGGKPILVTSIVRRKFLADGKVNNDLRPYAEAMIAVGAEENVPVYDLNAVSAKIVEERGPEKSMVVNAAPADVTHFNEAGAKEVAVLVADFLKQTIPTLLAAPAK